MDMWQDLISFEEMEQESAKQKRKVVVFLVVDDYEIKVSDSNNGAERLIILTDYALQFKDRLKFLDIKGLGYLKYRYRKIIGNGRQGELAYYLHCEKVVKVG